MLALNKCLKLTAGLLWLSTSIFGAHVAAAGNPTIVYPTGLFPVDVQNVQTAISLGGTVLLKSTDIAGRPLAFNFGPPDRSVGSGVNLTTDVTIRGERVGGRMTTINGGYFPILGRLPVKSRIEGIDFESPLSAAILLVESKGTAIVGNRINAVVGVRVRFGTDGDGIDLFGNSDPQNAITGHVLIANNIIENLSADFSNGMQLDDVAADVDIKGNIVRFAQSNGPVQTIGITAFRSHNRVSIVGNDVSMGPVSLDAFPAAIFVGGDLDARYLVALNTVVVNHPNGDGIALSGYFVPIQNAVIVGNRITIDSSFADHVGSDYFGLAGVDAFGAVSNSLIAANRISGTSAFAIDVAGAGELADSDRLIENDLSRFTSLTTDIYFDAFTNNMLFIGRCKSDIDQGVNNQISCDAAGGGRTAAAALTRGTGFRAHLRDVSRLDTRGAILEATQERMTR